jgi:ATP-dependent Clp protease protease subunit
MPIGVPRIIYCWGEELPAQWTDIYNFIFRRRMVFLMQYLDDELCNQICGLLINIHMEDRAKDLEKKEMENSGLFKGSKKTPTQPISRISSNAEESIKESNLKNIDQIDDLLKSEDDLAIDENYKLEQYTLQKITLEWLNWNAQFFDYADEPYLFYLADILSKSFNETKEDAKLLNSQWRATVSDKFLNSSSSHFDIYSPFRIFSDLLNNSENLVSPTMQNHNELRKELSPYNIKGKKYVPHELEKDNCNLFQKYSHLGIKNPTVNLLSMLANTELWGKINEPKNQLKTTEKMLGQRRLRKKYMQQKTPHNLKLINQKIQQLYPQNNTFQQEETNYQEFREYYRKQTERTFQDEESKKVFMIINSFGGSVGNGITVHDALQFIKAGSLTLALGVAASAASLALAGGTIGERYVTEGCHVMIHQPESALSGQASDIWIDSQEIMKIRQEVANIYSLSTYRPRHKILRDLDRDFYLTATETIYYGLADEIASNEVMHEIIEMTNKVWDYHDTKQQRLLESRDNLNSGVDTQTQNF